MTRRWQPLSGPITVACPACGAGARERCADLRGGRGPMIASGARVYIRTLHPERAKAFRETRRYVTKSGTVLTEADLERLADDAERGYCTRIIGTEEFRARCFLPMPCPIHGPGEPEPGPDAEHWSPEAEA